MHTPSLATGTPLAPPHFFPPSIPKVLFPVAVPPLEGTPFLGSAGDGTRGEEISTGGAATSV
jgi:hypothetical protein